jgi:hypothetical protein
MAKCLIRLGQYVFSETSDDVALRIIVADNVDALTIVGESSSDTHFPSVFPDNLREIFVLVNT